MSTFKFSGMSKLVGIAALIWMPSSYATIGSVMPSAEDVAITSPRTTLPNLLAGVADATLGGLIAKVQTFDSTPADQAILNEIDRMSAQNTGKLEQDRSPQTEQGQTGKPLFIQSEAATECRAPRGMKASYNFKAVTEAECMCELYQRAPSARATGVSVEQFHWIKRCKKARFIAG